MTNQWFEVLGSIQTRKVGGSYGSIQTEGGITADESIYSSGGIGCAGNVSAGGSVSCNNISMNGTFRPAQGKSIMYLDWTAVQGTDGNTYWALCGYNSPH